MEKKMLLMKKKNAEKVSSKPLVAEKEPEYNYEVTLKFKSVRLKKREEKLLLNTLRCDVGDIIFSYETTWNEGVRSALKAVKGTILCTRAYEEIAKEAGLRKE